MIRLAQSVSKSLNFAIKITNYQNTSISNFKTFGIYSPSIKYNFGIMDFATKQGRDKKLNQKQQAQFKKQVQLMANKPTYTLLDYKQRVLDSLNQIRKKGLGLAKYLNQDNKQQKELQLQKKVFLAMFDEQLKSNELLKGQQKRHISLASQIDIKIVNQTVKKFEMQQKMHRLLRQLKQDGQQLPTSVQQLQHMFFQSGLMHSGSRKQKYSKYDKRSKPAMNRYIKWGSTR